VIIEPIGSSPKVRYQRRCETLPERSIHRQEGLHRFSSALPVQSFPVSVQCQAKQAVFLPIGFETCSESHATLLISITRWSPKRSALMVPFHRSVPGLAKLLMPREIEEMTSRSEDQSAGMRMPALWQSAHGLARQITGLHEGGLQTARGAFRLSFVRHWSNRE
jgi:hypothetical protein